MVARLGRWFTSKLSELLYASGLLFAVLREALLFFRRRQVAFRVFVLQVLFTAVEALGIVAFIALALGALIIVQGHTLLPKFGQGKLLYSVLVIVITRELGPLLTAFIIIARSGTAIATELGNMVISHEIEAYVSVGIDPVAYLVVPRILGVTVSMVLLMIYFNFFGLIGSFLLTQLVQATPFREYLDNLLAAMTTADIFSSLIKAVVFGFIVSFVAVYQGFKVRLSSTEVPQIAIKAVGQGFVLCILADAMITLIYYL